MKKVISLALAMIMVFSFAACESAPAEEKPAETPAAPVETPAAPAETPAESTTVEAVDEAKIVEAVKAANGKVTDVAFADAETELTVTITMAADAIEEDVNAAMDALKAEIDTDAFLAANLFHNTEENLNKVVVVNFVMDGSSDVAYTAGATYSAGKGRKGMLYTRTKAWSAPEAVEVEEEVVAEVPEVTYSWCLDGVAVSEITAKVGEGKPMQIIDDKGTIYGFFGLKYRGPGQITRNQDNGDMLFSEAGTYTVTTSTLYTLGNAESVDIPLDTPIEMTVVVE